MMKKLKNFLAALIQDTFITVIIAVITVPALVTIFTGSIDLLIQYLSYDAPVWLVAACTIIGMSYIHFSRNRSTRNIQPKPYKFLIEDSGFKWRVIDHQNGFASVDQIPLCSVHECEYVLTPGEQYICRETFNSDCDEKIINASDLTFYWKLAKSKADSIINNYEVKH